MDIQLNKLSLKELREICKNKNSKGYTKFKKKDLIEFILKNDLYQQNLNLHIQEVKPKEDILKSFNSQIENIEMEIEEGLAERKYKMNLLNEKIERMRLKGEAICKKFIV